jgi:hypothetical protein
MKRYFLALLLSVLTFAGRAQNWDEIKKNYLLDDLSIYVEKFPVANTNPDRYSLDNKVYTINRKFVFDYYILRKGDTVKIKCPKIGTPDGDFQRDWQFIPKTTVDPDKIETISITVLPGITNTNQTGLKYEYQYHPEVMFDTFSSRSGVIENEVNTWMHPHRDKYFMILELNPFPYIQQPFKKGTRWTWELQIGDHWRDERWKMWNGTITNSYDYVITGRQNLKTPVGDLDCWVVESTATSSIGSTGLTAFYNENLGFVKLDYRNVDQSKTVITIKAIK